jgi:hypothetical protein
MLRKVLVSGVDIRLVSVGVCNPPFEIVGDWDLADATEELDLVRNEWTESAGIRTKHLTS